MAIAALLREARERRGFTLDTLAQETRIPRARLATFEQDGFRPDGGFYQRAQIRACARALRLDEQLVRDELDHAPAAPVPPPLRPPKGGHYDRQTAEPRARHSGGFSVAFTVGGAVAIALAASALMTRESTVGRTRESAPARAISTRTGSDTVPPVQRAQREQSLQVREPASRATAGSTEPADAPAAAVVSAVTELVITSQPEGARVTVDGVGWGVTPLTIRHLPPGVKRIRLTGDGYAAAERVVMIHPDRASRITVQLKSPTPSIHPEP